eukprot:XP_796428.3 PREDICTED: basic phospholipase A2 nigroxin B [Strongylocentrotus purpuratus]
MAPNEMFLQFAAMIQCTTKKNPIQYQGYGCHCGFLNGGSAKPVDATDQCCMDHDRCLKELETTGVCTKHAFITTYAVEMKGCGKKKAANITCKPQADYSPLEATFAFGKVDCAESLCRCDREAAVCFSQNPFQNRYKMGRKRKSACKAGPETGPGTGTATGTGTGTGTGPTAGLPTSTDKPMLQTTVFQPPVQETGRPAPIYRIQGRI